MVLVMCCCGSHEGGAILERGKGNGVGLGTYGLGPVDQGTDVRVAFWVNGQDDGMNKYTSDGLFAVWNAFKANDITIPFPHAAVAFKGSLPT